MRAKKYAAFSRPLLAMLAVLSLGLGDKHFFAVREGNKHYRGGDYDEALKNYRRAQVEKDSDVAKYNLGNTYFKKKNYDKAARLFAGMLGSKDEALSLSGLFNYGTAKLGAGMQKLENGPNPAAVENLEEAVGGYRALLTREPGNLAAKHNMEIALKKLEELKEKQNKKGGEEEQSKKEESEKEDGKKQSSNNENEEQDKKAGKGRERDKENTQNQKGEEDGKMTPEEVEKILKALALNERKVQKEIRRFKTQEKKTEKDW